MNKERASNLLRLFEMKGTHKGVGTFVMSNRVLVVEAHGDVDSLIGSLLMLREPWYFRLYFERRNTKLVNAVTGQNFGRYAFPDSKKVIGMTVGGYKICLDDFGIPKDDKEKDEMELSRTWRQHKAMAYIDVCFPEGTTLTVDRVYIRKGVDAYNSLTFWVKKPPKLKKPKKGEPPLVLTPEYEFLQKVGGNRFWAKLPDVNKSDGIP